MVLFDMILNNNISILVSSMVCIMPLIYNGQTNCKLLRFKIQVLGRWVGGGEI